MSACQLIRQRADNYDITPAFNWTQQQKTEQRTKKFPRCFILPSADPPQRARVMPLRRILRGAKPFPDS
jgi:hypothetical protein